MRAVPVMGVIAMCWIGPAGLRAESPLEIAHTSLQQARDTQTDIVAALAELNRRRQRSASMTELFDTLSAIHQMQTAVVRSTQTMMARTFGQSAEALPEADRHAIDQLAADGRVVRQRFTEWMTAFTQYATGDDVPQPVRVLHSRAAASPAGSQIEQAIKQIGENHLSQAAATGQNAADEIARLLQALESVSSDPDDLKDKRIRALREILDRQRQVRSHLESPSLGPEPWRRVLREQADVTERTRTLTFEEAGIVPAALEYVREAHRVMESAQKQIRSQQRDEAVKSAEAAIVSLEQAIEALEEADLASLKGEMPTMPPVKRRPDKLGGMPAMMGTGGAGVDVSPVATLIADIALVAKLRQRQAALYAETVGKAPPKPLPDGRQQSYAAQLPPLIPRVELILPEVAAGLEEARQAMVESVDRLRAEDMKGSAARQEVVLDRLASAEEKMRQFLKDLLETLSRISTIPGQAPSHGANEGEEEKAKTKLFLIMFRQIVRLGELIKDLDVLIARTEGWAGASPDTIDPQDAADGARKQRELSKTAFDILKKLKPLPGEVVGSLPEGVLEAGQWLEGAADMLDVSKFNTALERQRVALEFLESAYTVMAQSMATLMEGQQSDESEQRDRQGQPEIGEGDGAGATTEGKTGDDRPWYWNLPPQAREAISQSLAQPLPPAYELAIKRYYERLSHSKKGGR